MTIDYHVAPGGRLSGRFTVPGDKSISHRALMLAAIAEGTSRITGFLEAADTLATRDALAAMGVAIERDGDVLVVTGRGRDGLTPPTAALDLGNSATAARLLAGLLAGLGVRCELTGDHSLRSRPMGRIVEPLRAMRADITCHKNGTLPIRIGGGDHLAGIDYTLPVASAQIKSALLLAGLSAEGTTCLREVIATRDHTERMLPQFGYALACKGNAVSLEGGGTLRAASITIPADISSAAFFIVGATIAARSEIVIGAVGVNPKRDAAIGVLQAMGADIALLNERVVNGEPVADIRVRSAALHGIDIPPARVPSAIDEFPALLVAAACAEGKTTLTGAGELRVKESDRIATMARGLRTLGVEVEERADGMIVSGNGKLGGGEIISGGDHRIAMAFAVAGLNAHAPIVIGDCANVDTSFPGFVGIARDAGLDVHAEARA